MLDTRSDVQFLASTALLGLKERLQVARNRQIIQTSLRPPSELFINYVSLNDKISTPDYERLFLLGMDTVRNALSAVLEAVDKCHMEAAQPKDKSTSQSARYQLYLLGFCCNNKDVAGGVIGACLRQEVLAACFLKLDVERLLTVPLLAHGPTPQASKAAILLSIFGELEDVFAALVKSIKSGKGGTLVEDDVEKLESSMFFVAELLNLMLEVLLECSRNSCLSPVGDASVVSELALTIYAGGPHVASRLLDLMKNNQQQLIGYALQFLIDNTESLEADDRKRLLGVLTFLRGELFTSKILELMPTTAGNLRNLQRILEGAAVIVEEQVQAREHPTNIGEFVLKYVDDKLPDDPGLSISTSHHWTLGAFSSATSRLLDTRKVIAFTSKKE